MTTLAEKVPPEFWPTIDKLDEILPRIGHPEIRPLLEKIALLDPDAIRRVLPAWGSGSGSAQQALSEDLPLRLDRVVQLVNQRWEGPAAEQFTEHMKQVTAVFQAWDDPAGQVADYLGDFLDSLELTWLDIVGKVVGWAGLILTVVGIIAAALGTAAAPTGVGVVVAAIGWVTAIAGLVLGIVGIVVSDMQYLEGQLSVSLAGAKEFHAQVKSLRDKQPDSYVLPDGKQWEKKTPDPDN